MAFPKITPEFELPNLCGAKAPFDDIQKQLSASLDNLNLNLELPAIDIVNQLELDVTAALGKLDGLQMPELPSLPDISLGAEISGLLSIATDSAAGLAQFAAKKLELCNTFGDALSGIGADFESLLGDISGGLPICDVPNMIVPAAGGSPQEKPASTIIADEAPVGEAPAKPIDNSAAAASANSTLAAVASTFKSTVSSLLGKEGILSTTPQPGLKITKEIEDNFRKLDARAKIESVLGGAALNPGNLINIVNAGALTALKGETNTSGDGLSLSEVEAAQNNNSRAVAELHASTTAVVQKLGVMLKASIATPPFNQALNPDTGEADGTFIFAKLAGDVQAAGVAAVSEVNWDAINNKRIELQKQLDDRKLFDAAQIFAQGVKFELKPFQALAEEKAAEADELIELFKKKFIQNSNEGKLIGESINV